MLMSRLKGKNNFIFLMTWCTGSSEPVSRKRGARVWVGGNGGSGQQDRTFVRTVSHADAYGIHLPTIDVQLDHNRSLRIDGGCQRANVRSYMCDRSYYVTRTHKSICPDNMRSPVYKM